MADPIPLTITKAANAKVFLDLYYSLEYHEQDSHLTTVQSQLQLKVANNESGADDGASLTPVITYDYTQMPDNKYPSAHVHIEGNVDTLQRMLTITGVPDKKPADLHMSVGSSLFRPCLEDVIEFCILEGLVKAHTGWKDTLSVSRERYHEDQLRSAALTKIDYAAQVLRDLGYSVHKLESQP